MKMEIIKLNKESFLKAMPFTSCTYTLRMVGPKGVDLRPLAY